MSIQAVIFDLGGVVFDSPLPCILAYERDAGLPAGTIGKLLIGGGGDGPWPQLERGDLSMDAFDKAFAAAGRELSVELSGRDLMQRIGNGVQLRPSMLAAIQELRQRGFKTAALTNNWPGDDGFTQGIEVIRPLFDVFIESWKVRLRKPDERIYQLALNKLDVSAQQAVFLDDLGHNLKSARAMGITTIKVADPAVALQELWSHLAPGVV